MKPHVRHYRAIVLVTSSLRLRAPFVIVCLLILTMLYQPASAQQSDAGAVANPAPLTAEQVVHNLALMNLHRAQALHPYQETRTYRVQYHGFPGTRDAEMVVIVKYLSPGQKEFVIQSADWLQTDRRQGIEEAVGSGKRGIPPRWNCASR